MKCRTRQEPKVLPSRAAGSRQIGTGESFVFAVDGFARNTDPDLRGVEANLVWTEI